MTGVGSGVSKTETSGKIVDAGAHHAWVASEISGKDQLDALWRTYLMEFLRTLFYEISHRAAGYFNGLGGRYDVPPVWTKDGTRVGGYEKLGQILEASTGYQKLNALLSGMSPGTCQAYVRGWRRWAQYCNLRGQAPWVVVGEPGWDEATVDFIMFEHSVM